MTGSRLNEFERDLLHKFDSQLHDHQFLQDVPSIAQLTVQVTSLLSSYAEVVPFAHILQDLVPIFFLDYLFADRCLIYHTLRMVYQFQS